MAFSEQGVTLSDKVGLGLLSYLGQTGQTRGPGFPVHSK